MDPRIDPRFPDRPQHDDFWSIMDVVNHLDARATEDKQPLPQILTELVGVDTESLTYMAEQRALQAVQLLHLNARTTAALASVFINAFSAGVLFERKRFEAAARTPIRTRADLDTAMQQVQIDDAVEMLNHDRFVVVQYHAKQADPPAIYGPYTAQAEALADRDRRHQHAVENWAADVVAKYGEPVTEVVALWSTTED